MIIVAGTSSQSTASPTCPSPASGPWPPSLVNVTPSLVNVTPSLVNVTPSLVNVRRDYKRVQFSAPVHKVKAGKSARNKGPAARKRRKREF